MGLMTAANRYTSDSITEALPLPIGMTTQKIEGQTVDFPKVYNPSLPVILRLVRRTEQV